MSDGSGSRAAAVRAVAAVIGRGQLLDVALADSGAEPADRAFVQALAFGSLRFGHRLKEVAALLATRKWDALSPEVQALLLVGLYQLEYADTAAHAAVSATVAAARRVGEVPAAGFINACLRRFQREREALLAMVDQSVGGRTSHPAWMVDAIERDWHDQAERILQANNIHPPLTLRVNARRTTPEALAEELALAGHVTHTVPFAPSALDLEKPTDVRALVAFTEGRCSVQDAAAQLAVPLLAARAGMRVLDACAAPGGKTCHLLEAVPDLAEVVALDIDAGRVDRIRDNLDRLGLAATLRVGDALDPAATGGGLFDRILIDAPCSGTGVIRRHPDIKWLRRPRDLTALVERQQRMLQALWPQLAPGGRLVYATCSVLRAENVAVIRKFLAATPAAVDVTESASLAVAGLPPLPAPRGPGLALVPGVAGTDGFYYACLERAG
ncbi:MAG: 16S rRNA (cytosine(967)-C(5))-methyltransferase RsmB [Pseudomonadota bacterium]